jgi:hypothetical protein
MKLMKEINFFYKSPYFYFHGNCGKVFYFVPLDVDVTGNITSKICEVRSEFNIFCTLVTMATAAILNFFNPQKLPHYGGYSYKVL